MIRHLMIFLLVLAAGVVGARIILVDSGAGNIVALVASVVLLIATWIVTYLYLTAEERARAIARSVRDEDKGDLR